MRSATLMLQEVLGQMDNINKEICTQRRMPMTLQLNCTLHMHLQRVSAVLAARLEL